MTRFIVKAILVCLVVCFALGGRAQASPNADAFSHGNTLYAAGDFTGAVAAYEGQVRRGEYTANLFYNLADAYHRQGDRGRAILNYQRALILDPAHAEAAANLAFVRGLKSPTPARASWIDSALPWLTQRRVGWPWRGLVLVLSGRRGRGAGYLLLATGLSVGAAGGYRHLVPDGRRGKRGARSGRRRQRAGSLRAGR